MLVLLYDSCKVTDFTNGNQAKVKMREMQAILLVVMKFLNGSHCLNSRE